MKIHELRFKNLNSLVGEWVIDFTAPEYSANSIFALTGPTGAGKSTILDGLCLALYGATPRLGKITRSSNEIMSRQTGECYAEVLFESQAGRFRCHWEQRRARKQRSGNLQDQQHQIINAETNTPIETKKSLVLKVIEEKTGMDFDRFTRSILLAQGGFDTFLKADDEQKSRILEQITGTEIYSTISRRVHERQRHELEKLTILNAETSGIRLLDTVQINEIQQQLAKKQRDETALLEKHHHVQKGITWLAGIEKLEKELENLASEEYELKKQSDAFAADRIRLDRAAEAAAVEGHHAALVSAREQRSEDQAALSREKKTVPELVAVHEQSAEALKSAAQQVLSSKKERDDSGPLLQKIRTIDQRLDDMRNNEAEVEIVCRKERNAIDSDIRNQRALLKRKEALTEDLKETERYLADHLDDSLLSSALTGIEVQLTNLQRRNAAGKVQEKAYKEAREMLVQEAEALDRCRLEVEAYRQAQQNVVSQIKEQNDSLHDLLGERLLREHRREKEYLLREQAFINRVTDLEAQRDHLTDGSPCPLCGATEHPYAQGNVPKTPRSEREIVRLTELIDTAEELEAAIRKLEESRALIEKKLAAAEKRLTAALNQRESAEKTCAGISENIENLKSEIEEIRNSLAFKLHPIGISEISEESGNELLQKLRDRLKTWQEKIEKKEGFITQLNQFEVELKQLETKIETRTQTLESNRKRLAEEIRKRCDFTEERKELFGDKSVDDEELRLSNAVTEAEKTEKTTASRHHVTGQNLDAARQKIDVLTARISQGASKLNRIEEDFQLLAKAAGFHDEQQFLDARLSKDERETLAAQAEELDKRVTDLAARKKDRQSRLQEARAQDVTNDPLEELGRQSSEYENSLKKLHDETADYRHQLELNKAAHEQMKHKQVAIELQKKESTRWDKLHLLIGSADGKKYRTFAQGLTFELMVSHANRQLAEMSDRYLLIRDAHQPLELNVIDSYQAGEVRSTRNLSGGESFLISLALALGLSRMASRNVRVDSLFLDEGFGTLDEDALESALTTLSALHQQNKVIGIISHVPALKDRISTQISVTPLSGGVSTLHGPGCARLQ